MTSAQAQELSRLKAHYKASGKLIEAKAVDQAIHALRMLDKEPAPKPVPPPKVESRRKPWPPARRHPDAVMLFGEAA